MEVYDLISETHLSQAISQMSTALKNTAFFQYYINPLDDISLHRNASFLTSEHFPLLFQI
jgi:hypothetical protein